ncbi:MAG: cytochrome [Herminiimonas sp.]|nr:cytochrome [Herminiimonas sp.]
MTPDKTRLVLKTMFATVWLIAVLGMAAGVLVMASGWYNIGATAQHWQPVHTFLEKGMRQSVRHHARDIRAPSLTAPTRIRRGAAIYRDSCVQCHGAPGVAPADIGKSMQPIPGPLVDAAKHWQASEMYWITRHGIKMSGMPAWEFRMSDDDIWSVVAFLKKLPELSPQAYTELTGRKENP